MKNTIFFFALIICLSCKQNTNDILISETYKTDIENYRNDLNEGRKNGYLQLTGLYKLDSLANSFGKSETNDFVLDVVDIPKKIGTIYMTKDSLYLSSESDIKITSDQNIIIKQSVLTLDAFGSSEKMYHKHINWQVITRSGSLYLRVWDQINPAIEAFRGFQFYPINQNLIIEAQFEYYDNAKTESVKSQLGVNTNTNFIGKVNFEYDGQMRSLDVGNNGFTMVGDVTTGDTTYGGGRYLYLKLPETDGIVTIDFNKLYNPPCSFNQYTTCLYPPQQNHLSFNVEAGETITLNN